jgi:hypothetical protein
MEVRPTRTQVAAAFVAGSGGAQVMAGVTGVPTLWQVVWLLSTMLAGAVGVLLAAVPEQKNPHFCHLSVKTLKVHSAATVSSPYKKHLCVAV